MRTAWLAAFGAAILLTGAGPLNADEREEGVRNALTKLGGSVAYSYIFTSPTGDDYEYVYESRLSEEEIKYLKGYYWGKVEHGEVEVANLPDPIQGVRVDLFASGASDAALEKLAPIRDEILILELSYTRVTDAAVGGLQGFPNLRKLYLTSTLVKGETLGTLAGHSGLEVLELDYAPLTDKGLRALSQLKGLKRLGLSGLRIRPSEGLLGRAVGVTPEVFGRLGECLPAGLEQLDLGDVSSLKSRPEDDGSVSAPSLAGLTRLRRLDLSQTRLKDGQLAGLGAPEALEGLDLSDTFATDDDVGRLAHAYRNLKMLDLSRTRVTGRVLDVLRKQEAALEELYLADTGIGDDALTAKDGYLASRRKELKGLSLSRTDVTAAGLQKLGKFTRLKYLYLEDLPELTDALADILFKDMADLEILDVEGTGVTNHGAKRLQPLHPGLKVWR